MKEILKLQLFLILIFIWVVGSLTPLLYGMFNDNSIIPIMGLVFFFVFMYPMIYINKKLFQNERGEK
jgi:hypothetical protein